MAVSEKRFRAALFVTMLAVLTTLAASPTAHGATAAAKPLAIGDSVMFGARHDIARKGITPNVDKSRQFIAGTKLIRSLRKNGKLPTTVVVHLGTNGPITAKQFNAMMRQLKGRTTLFLTVKAPRYWETQVNSVIKDGVKRWRNAKLLDWKAIGSKNPGWFWADGIHLSPQKARGVEECADRYGDQDDDQRVPDGTKTAGWIVAGDRETVLVAPMIGRASCHLIARLHLALLGDCHRQSAQADGETRSR